jgi:hypothetical protein
LLVPGEAPLLFARARACENRVFLVSAESAGWRVIDPRGIVIHEHVARAELDVAAAATKTVAPRTDVICGRRPELFEFKAA